MAGWVHLQRNVRATIGLALLVALGTGAMLAATAGARRTESAFPRLLRATKAAPVWFAYGPRANTGIDPDAVEARAGDLAVGRMRGIGVTTRRPDGRPGFFGGGEAFYGTASDGRLFYDVSKPRILEGRLPTPSEIEEVAINATVAELVGLGVGDTLEAYGFDFAEAAGLGEELGAIGREPTPEEIDLALSRLDLRAFDLRITGIVEDPTDLAFDERSEGENVRLFLTPAFAAAEREQYGYLYLDPTRVPNGQARLDALLEEFPGLSLLSVAQKEDDVGATSGALAGALLAFGVVVALALLVIVGPALRRHGLSAAGEADVLVALGMRRRAAGLATATRSIVATLLGAALGGLGAYLASGLFPLAPLDRAEGDAGLRLDPLVHVGGVAVTTVVLVAVATIGSRRRASSFDAVTPSRTVSALGRAGAPAPLLEGVRRALQRPTGPGGHPALVLAAVGVAVIAALSATTFGSSLDALVENRRDHGIGWDTAVQAGDGSDPALFAGRVIEDPDLRDVTLVTTSPITVDGRPLSVLGVDYVRGTAGPVFYDGRRPSAKDEIALGASTLRSLGKRPGDNVELSHGETLPRRFTIVGKVVMPDLDASNFDTDLGNGGVVVVDAMSALGIDTADFATQALVGLAPGVDRTTFVEPYGFEVRPVLPAEVRNFARVRDLPRTLAAVLGVLGLGALTHGLLGTVRSRRRELGVLRALGFVRRQVVASVAAQAVAVALVASAAGLLGGVVVGRLAWRTFATSLGVVPEVALPTIVLVGTAPVVVLLALVIALPSGWRAARVRAAEVLRVE